VATLRLYSASPSSAEKRGLFLPAADPPGIERVSYRVAPWVSDLGVWRDT
jgi:hypothetical protein